MTAAGYRTHFQTAETFLDVFYRKLVPDTAEHRSSTLQDIKAGKRTEIDALNGAVIELSKKLGIDVPYNYVAYNLVKFLEANNL
jgi:2-dehydropantoate 2-reductase